VVAIALRKTAPLGGDEVQHVELPAGSARSRAR
jgi:hypothetical protein